MSKLKVNAVLLLMSISLITGCSKDIVKEGIIKDEVSVHSISDGDLVSEMGGILSEDGYTGSINDVPLEEKTDVLENDTVYFAYDSSEITSEMKSVIDKHMNFLLKHTDIKVILEGHTDERGANSYNVVLGEKRAQSVKDVILEAGVPDTQIEIISYGELKPLGSGGNESSWSKDRRAVFTYQ
jgi:peptidoglycan-associated lipoprotein